MRLSLDTPVLTRAPSAESTQPETQKAPCKNGPERAYGPPLAPHLQIGKPSPENKRLSRVMVAGLGPKLGSPDLGPGLFSLTHHMPCYTNEFNSKVKAYREQTACEKFYHSWVGFSCEAEGRAGTFSVANLPPRNSFVPRPPKQRGVLSHICELTVCLPHRPAQRGGPLRPGHHLRIGHHRLHGECLTGVPSPHPNGLGCHRRGAEVPLKASSLS